MNVSINAIKKTYSTVTVLNEISINFETKKFTSLLGPSGCGKTTLLRIIAGLETPDSGEIYFGDTCVFSSAKKINIPSNKRKLGMVFQDFALWPHMTVFENIAYPLNATGKKEKLKERVYSAIKTVRLDGLEKRHPFELSGGQQQRVAFARAIVNDPEIILFDEPLSALDANLRDEMRFELVNLVKKLGITVIYVTHDQTEAMSMSNKVIVMNKGDILQEASPETIYHKPYNKFVAQFVGKSNVIANGFIRPENISLVEEENSILHKGIVENAAYLGNCYELTVKLQESLLWKVYSDNKKGIGEEINLYVKNSNIYLYEEEKNV